MTRESHLCPAPSPAFDSAMGAGSGVGAISFAAPVTEAAQKSSMLEPQPKAAENAFIRKKEAFEAFTKRSLRSDVLKNLAEHNRSYRHVARFSFNVLMLVAFIAAEKLAFRGSSMAGWLLYPVFLYFQALLIAGFMIHSHELSHDHIKSRWLNDGLGIISGMISFINFYSFQYAHRWHHRNIGNLDTPEAGAPVSPRGQQRLRNHDRPRILLDVISKRSPLLWILTSWIIFIWYGDYCSWLRPYRVGTRMTWRSIAVFIAIFLTNIVLVALAPIDYLLLYLLPALVGGSRILAITYLHHAHEDLVYFDKNHHNFMNVIMATTDRDYGKIVNFFMLNNGYHIPHHMNPQIAYYDLKRASLYLRSTVPPELKYHFYKNSKLFRDLAAGLYEQRLTENHEVYQLKYRLDISKKSEPNGLRMI